MTVNKQGKAGHSVADHLRIQIADYDNFIRTVIPHYEVMHENQLNLLELVLPEGGRVLDLGGGTGGLAAVVADRFPTANVEIWDTDPAMLDVAMERCRSFGNRVSGVCRSFADGLPRCDAVVACIALHHVMDLEAKRAIYANIHRALRKGGIFANADCTMSASAVIRGACFAIWTQFMRDNGLSDAEVRRNYESWAREDYYPPIETELGLLKDAGFAEPDCFWRSAPFAVFGGVR